MIWVVKPWGRTTMFLADDAHEIWMAQASQGRACSIHLHCDKSNAFHVLEGRVLVRLHQGDELELKSGMSAIVAAGIPHQFEALTAASMVEVYRPEPGRLLLPGELDIARFHSWEHAERFIVDPLLV